MIKRELYMSRIRPFIGTDLIKVMTGIRRCGKSVMLELIKQELTESGVSSTQFISINFEDMSYRRSRTGRSASTLSAFRWIAISTSPARMQSYCPVNSRLTWAVGMWSS